MAELVHTTSLSTVKFIGYWSIFGTEVSPNFCLVLAQEIQPGTRLFPCERVGSLIFVIRITQSICFSLHNQRLLNLVDSQMSKYSHNYSSNEITSIQSENQHETVISFLGTSNNYIIILCHTFHIVRVHTSIIHG